MCKNGKSPLTLLECCANGCDWDTNSKHCSSWQHRNFWNVVKVGSCAVALKAAIIPGMFVCPFLLLSINKGKKIDTTPGINKEEKEKEKGEAAKRKAAAAKANEGDWGSDRFGGGGFDASALFV